MQLKKIVQWATDTTLWHLHPLWVLEVVLMKAAVQTDIRNRSCASKIQVKFPSRHLRQQQQ